MVRDGSPQSPRDKRPLSGPNIRTPNLPVTEGVMKTAQQNTRPFNTYPRTDSDGGRSPTGQVRPTVLTKREKCFYILNFGFNFSFNKYKETEFNPKVILKVD